MKKKFSNVGSVIQKEKSMHKKILISLFLILILNSCTEWAAILMSSGGFVAGQNAYSKAYGGANVLTILRTEKDIKTHAKEQLHKLRK